MGKVKKAVKSAGGASSRKSETEKGTELSLHQRIIRVIKKVPRGRVASYGQIAGLAGAPGAARQVAWALSSSSRRENLPWWRIINQQGGISIPRGKGYERQKLALEEEGVEFGVADRVDLQRFGWKPRKTTYY